MPDEENKTIRATGRIDDQALARLRARMQASGGAFSLLLYSRDGLRAVPLQEGRSLVIGRFPPADITIRDSSVSRRHARVSLRRGEVSLEDLGSTNGTWLRGERVERGKLRPGDALAFGSVLAALHAREVERLEAGIGDHDSFMVQLEAEVLRARSFQRHLALALLRGPSFTRWASELAAWLRPFEPAALYSQDCVEILLPEADAGQAQARLDDWLKQAGPGPRCGLAAFPEHGTSAQVLLQQARAALRRSSARRPLQAATARGERGAGTEEPVIESPAMRRLFGIVDRLASSTIPVLLMGETGSGKEVLAHAIHDRGKRAGKPLVCVNCGGIPGQLVESTLFGHERGAFTGAEQKRQGVFEAARGGTVLLDEVGELPAAAQAALLRVLESKRFSRVGSTAEIEADVRVLAATHRDLEAMCAQGGFRWDLFYRLNAMTLEIPPLRDRPEEVEPLCRRFMALANRANDRQLTGIEKDAAQLLRRHSWPGNLRELRNVIERAVVIAQGPLIAVEDLPRNLRRLAEAGKGALPETPSGADLKQELRDYEAQLITSALRRSGGERKAAAEILGLPLRTLSHKMKALGIRRGSYQRES